MTKTLDGEDEFFRVSEPINTTEILINAPTVAFPLKVINNLNDSFVVEKSNGTEIFRVGAQSEYIFCKNIACTGFITGKRGHAGQMKATSSTNISNNLFTFLLFDTENFDTNGSIVDLANEKFVVQKAGLYFVSCYTSFQANISGGRRIGIVVNGVFNCIENELASSSSNTHRMSVEDIISLDVNDEITFEVWQNSGGSLSAGTASGTVVDESKATIVLIDEL